MQSFAMRQRMGRSDELGHSPPKLPAPVPPNVRYAPNRDKNIAAPGLVANGMDRPRSRPRRHAECAGGLSGEGALPCFAQPPFTQ